MTVSAVVQPFLKSSIFLSAIILPHSRYQSASSAPDFVAGLAGGGGSVGLGAVVSLPVVGLVPVFPLSTCSSDFFLLHAMPAETASASTRVVRILIRILLRATLPSRSGAFNAQVVICWRRMSTL